MVLNSHIVTLQRSVSIHKRLTGEFKDCM